MNAADVMSPVVVAVHPDAPLAQVVRLMIEHRVSGLPVLDEGGHAVGIITEGDLLRRVETETDGGPPGWLGALFASGRAAGDYVQTHTRRVADLMTADVVSVTTDTPLDEVVSLMRRRRIRRVPVALNGVIVGIVSRADLVRALAGKLDSPPATAADAAIQTTILAELARQPWGAHRSVTVGVAGGVVGLDGVVFDARERDAFRVAAENTAGVLRVENRIICVEPTTGMLIFGPDDEARQAAAARAT